MTVLRSRERAIARAFIAGRGVLTISKHDSPGSTAAPAFTAGASAAEGTGWAVSEEAGALAGVPGAPGMALAARGGGAGAGPRYGFRPVVMPRHVVG